MEAVIRAKAEEGKPAEVEAPAEPGRVVDLMAALRDSARATKEARGQTADKAEVHPMRPQKKASAKKTTKRTAS
ncbi:hypothetical protein ACWDSL_06420 [Streptomyces sp. NPDC000941]